MKQTVKMTHKLLTVIAVLSFITATSREKQGAEVNPEAEKVSYSAKVMGACKSPKSSQELWVNNVRTIIYTGGDMWWDLFGSGNAYYIVPATKDRSQGISANFAGSIWIGGLDGGGQLKIAAMTYRQTGYDFWPGPLDPATASTDEEVCNDYDKIFVMTRSEVENFVFNGVVTDAIKNWPGNGIKNDRPNLAPFVDVNGSGFYDPTEGDYPYYDIYNLAEKDNLGVCKAKLFGDATLWWVFNDKGDIHTETGGQPIGLEVRAQAFGFKTNDDINNMTFYSYEVLNRSTFSLNQTYFSVWTDADLGNYIDDYVGCDIDKGLGFIYNSDGNDENYSGALGYGEFPVALGCDFFKGPLADVNDGKDNDFDGTIDELGETIGMSKFLYYNNNIGSFPVQTTNPALASHFYNYMTGFWKDGSPFTEGGNAYGGSTPVDYVYPGELYPTDQGWTETSAGNLPGDRRFLQSAGPFLLLPGAVNNVTFGLPWARSPIKNNNRFAVALLKTADQKAQSLFDNCFKILDGPEAPDMTIQESNNELMIYLSNKATSNNYLNAYAEKDVTILAVDGQTASCLSNPDQTYRFEGYKVYQVKDGTVSQTDVDDPTKAKLVFQCDVKNGITRLVNYNFDGSVNADVPSVKVEGVDEGISTTFKVTEDAFASGANKKLVNNKTYYFMAFAYAYNNYATYKQDQDPTVNPCENYFGQKRPYLEGRKVKKAAGIPHLATVEYDGTIIQSNYGYGPKIKRIEGQGNGGNIVDLTDETVNEILATGFARNPVYQNGRGPIQVKVVDPLNIPNSTFTVKFLKMPSVAYTPTGTPMPNAWATAPTSTNNVQSAKDLGYTYANNITLTNLPLNGGAVRGDSLTWVLTDVNSGAVYQPKKSIRVGEEHYFSEIGLSVNIQQVSDVGSTLTNTTSITPLCQKGDLLDASITFADPTKQWLTGIVDTDDQDETNWVRSGSKTGSAQGNYPDYASDPEEVFDNILGGTWAPYSLVSTTTRSGTQVNVAIGPGYNGNFFATTDGNRPTDTDIRFLASVDVVLTPDKSKWTRCVVLEMQVDSTLSENVTRHFGLRDHASVDKNGNYATVGSGASNDPNAPNYIAEKGMGWFPGYAINVETGERLNMAFGEDSYNFADNGNDMIWNPTSTVNGSVYQNAWGGRHFIYVFGNNKKATYGSSMNSSFTGISSLTNTPVGAGRYDACKQIYDQLSVSFSAPNNTSTQVAGYQWPVRNVMRDAMWVSVPRLRSTAFAFKDPSNMPCEVKVRLRVKKAYRYGLATMWSNRNPITSTNYVANNVNYLTQIGYPNLPSDTSTARLNNNMPMYEFSTSDIYTMINNAQTAKNALDYIRVVPNPYYGYSKYESNRIDSRVRITNLPSLCTIKIFTMNGTLIRTFKRDVSGQEDDFTNTNDIKQSKRTPYLDWDLKNQYGVPIASGLYIIHIDAGDKGEKILKWFGVIRPMDLQNY